MGSPSEAEIKQALAHTWVPFFSRFGRLTEIQSQTIPLVLGGRNVVVISPSASGKTEAIMAPVVERLLPRGAHRLSVLYVTPTRALVNDLYRRLVDPLAYLGLELARKTGDHPAFKERQLPFAMITTPESFDSLICRHPGALKDLAAVVLDELHLLDNTPRGDQLRVLLERLRRINPNLQSYALSATIEDDEIGQRYFPEPVVVKVSERRSIEYLLMPDRLGFIEEVLARLVRQGAEKVLFFLNARSLVETYSRRLDRPPFRGKVWAHHASLTKQQRDQVEQLMIAERRGILCATSTLELGIDIGDIDAVVLFRPPFSVSSLLQRIGRGNRRSGGSLFAVGIYHDPWERLVFEVFFDCARSGQLYERRYNACRSVLPQQMISYLFQRRRIGTTLEALKQVLAPICPDQEIIRLVFRHLIEEGYVVDTRPGIYHVGQRLEHETARGKIHSNIQEKSLGDYEVIESETGRSIGRVFYLFNRFVLAGRTWELVRRREREKKAYVRPVGGVQAISKVFEGTGTVGYHYRLAQRFKARLFPELEEFEMPFFVSHGQVYLLHFLGELYSSLICAAANRKGVEVMNCGGKAFMWQEESHKLRDRDAFYPIPCAPDLRRAIQASLSMLEDRLGSGAYFRLLPESLQIDDHFRALDIQGLLQFLHQVRLIQVAPEEARRRVPWLWQDK